MSTNLEKWINYYYAKVKLMMPALYNEMRRKKFTPAQAKAIIEGVLNRVIEKLDTAFA